MKATKMKYYLLEKNENHHSYRQYTFEELKDYFKDEDDKEIMDAWKKIQDIDDLSFFLEDYINNYGGIHYHDYYIEEV